MKKIVESSYEKAVEKIQNQKKTIEDLKKAYKKKLRSLQWKIIKKDFIGS